MFNKNKILCILLIFVLCLIITLFFLLSTNKTFFKNTYNSLNNQEIFIPKYSYLKEECCMYSATFYSLRSKQDIKQEIDLYLKDFTYFENDSTYGYLKNDLFIQRYGVEDQGLYRVIYIVY